MTFLDRARLGCASHLVEQRRFWLRREHGRLDRPEAALLDAALGDRVRRGSPPHVVAKTL
jgi:hypothetical protein